MPVFPSKTEFDSYAGNYDKALNQGLALTGEAKEFYAAGRVKWMRGRLDRWKCAPRACLDFGCGTGTSAPFLQEGLGIHSYAGYDPSCESIDEAKKSSLWPNASFTDCEQAVESGAFDLAFCNGVFHHIEPEQRDAAMQTVRRALKPGGIFAFWENNRWNPAVHYVMSRVPFDKHAQMLYPFQARALLHRAGFSVLSTDYLFIFPGVLSHLRPLERMLCKVPLGGQYLVLARKE